MSINFEYVASGIAHTRIINKEFSNEPETVLDVQKRISAIQNRYNHKTSFLFNGFTEEKLGKKIKECFEKNLHNIYADSGGLQIITLGKTINDSLKRNVYEVQSNYSSIALSFDEIPLVVIGNRSTFHDTSSRYFDKSILEEKARLSGKNLLEQIQFFTDKKSDTKPLLIIQGNSLETYQAWLDYVVEEVGIDNLKYVSGISSGAAALGQGLLEDVKRYFILAHLQTPIKFEHIHMLGVGSTSRLVPLIILNSIGYFENVTLSYDSTTHTSGLSRGHYFINNRLMPMSRYRGYKFELILDDINSNLKEMGLDPIEDENLYNQISVNDTVRYKQSSYIRYSVIYSYLMSQIFNFIKSVDRMTRDKNYMISTIGKDKHKIPLLALEHCRDWADFVEWENRFNKDIESKAVLEKKYGNQKSSLKGFFV